MADFGIAETLLAASSAVGAVGSVVGAAGQQQAGQQAAQADLLNAEIQRRNAAVVMAQARSQAAIDAQKTALGLGGVQAAYGASGVSASQGSPLDVMRAVASAGEVERQLDIYRGTVQASGAMTQAQIDQLEAQRAQQAGQTAATGTLLTGLGAAARNIMPLFSGSGGGSAAPAYAGGQDYSSY